MHIKNPVGDFSPTGFVEQPKLGERIVEKGIRLLPLMDLSQVDTSQARPIPEAKSKLEIIVHAMEIGMGVLGHVDICIEGYVYSYGNYDELACILNGARGEGVLLKAPREDYFKFCKRHYQKTLYIYSLEVTDEQLQLIKNRLEKVLKESFTWSPPDDICSFNPVSEKEEEMYAYFMVQCMPVTFYKFRKTQFKLYTMWRNNCLLFVDYLVSALKIRPLRARMTTFPSLYQERLESLKEKQHSIVTDCQIY